MTYKLPEPDFKSFVRGDLFVAEKMQAAYAAWQRDMLARCVEVLTRYNDCSDAYEEMKELLNEQH